ncbi:hypothetical protein WEI85_37505 [Actinomycetes bacterium KLBMP 9797]
MLVGAVVSLGACVLGVFTDGHATPLTIAHLVLAGLGWNAGVVGASALLTRAVPDGLRPHTEGIGEATMGTAAVAVAPLAAVLPDAWDHVVLGLCAAAMSVLALVEVRRIPAGPLPQRPSVVNSKKSTTTLVRAGAAGRQCCWCREPLDQCCR